MVGWAVVLVVDTVERRIRSDVVCLTKPIRLVFQTVLSLTPLVDSHDPLYIFSLPKNAVFEMCHKGVLMDVDVEHAAKPYSDEECRRYFREMVLGIEYREWKLQTVYCEDPVCCVVLMANQARVFIP